MRRGGTEVGLELSGGQPGCERLEPSPAQLSPAASWSQGAIKENRHADLFAEKVIPRFR